MTINVPTSIWSRLPGKFAAGAVAIVAAAIVIGAVAVRSTDGSGNDDRAQRTAGSDGSITVHDEVLRSNESMLRDILDAAFNPPAPAVFPTEDSVRVNEAQLEGDLGDYLSFTAVAPAQPLIVSTEAGIRLNEAELARVAPLYP